MSARIGDSAGSCKGQSHPRRDAPSPLAPQPEGSSCQGPRGLNSLVRAIDCPERLAHKIDTDQVCGESACSADANLNLTKSLKNCCVVFATQEGRIHAGGNQRIQLPWRQEGRPFDMRRSPPSSPIASHAWKESTTPFRLSRPRAQENPRAAASPMLPLAPCSHPLAAFRRSGGGPGG